MRTICEWIDCTIDNAKVLREIEETFPCFVRINDINDLDYLEVEICCREEDAVSIERLLASCV